MKKEEFIKKLREELKGYPRDAVEDSIQYYNEMIDDRMEDGMSEDGAVADVGDPTAIAKQIKYDMPLKNVIKEKVVAKKVENEGKGVNVGLIVLLILGAPLWLPLSITALVLIGVFFLLLWVFDLVAFVASLASAVGVIASIYGAFTYFAIGEIGTGIFLIGGGVAAAGVAILLALGGVAFYKVIIAITKACAKGTKKAIIGK